jgi:hypothetical protein
MEQINNAHAITIPVKYTKVTLPIKYFGTFNQFSKTFVVSSSIFPSVFLKYVSYLHSYIPENLYLHYWKVQPNVVPSEKFFPQKHRFSMYTLLLSRILGVKNYFYQKTSKNYSK